MKPAPVLDLSRLNPPQRQAVLAGDGPLLVLAGAGSGKTRVIAHRVARLLRDGEPPEAILAVTFTNKAAAEMRERVADLAGRAAARVRVSTFHAFGLWLLQKEREAAGLPRRFAVRDAGDQVALVRRCLAEVRVDDRRFDARRVLALLSRAKNEGRSQVPVRPAGQGDDYDLAASEVFPRYQAALSAQRALDFDDLLARPVQLLSEQPGLRRRWRERFRHVLVDEYQDTNPAQLSLLRLLCAPERRGGWAGRSLCAVGDDDQAIYGWRGAEVRNILRFERHFPGAAVIRLEQNYRSGGNILACANAVIARSAARREKRLWTAAGPGEPVRVAALPGEEEEAALAAAEIARGLSQGRAPGDFAVLYRLNAQSRPFEEALRAAGIPHVVHGGPAFFDRAEVRDLLAWLKVCASPADEVSLARVVDVPPRGVGDVTLGRISAWAGEQGVPLLEALRRAPAVPGLAGGAAARAQELVVTVERQAARFRHGALAEAARAMVADLDLEAHVRKSLRSPEAAVRAVDGLRGLVRSLEAYEQRERRPSLRGFLDRLALDAREEEPAAGEGVRLMTLHAAKGLEFPVVFLAGVEEDLLPVAGIQGEARDLEEERRLCYVGMTQARERLWLLRVAARPRRGRLEPRTPSRFLSDLPPGAFLAHDPAAAEDPAENAARSAEVLAALRRGLGGRG